MRTIMLEYFNQLHQIKFQDDYVEIMESFIAKPDLEKLFAGYWKLYISQFPADIFAQVNENFYRSTFYEVSRRYLSHLLSFYVERSLPSGRSDLEFIGNYNTILAGLHYVLEFKYISNSEIKKQKINLKKFALVEQDKNQVEAYAKDIQNQRPKAKVSAFVVYCFGNQGYRIFNILLAESSLSKK